MNKAIIIGRLGRDPEVRYMPSGEAVCNFSVATSEKWKDKNSGEAKEETTWHRISAWGRQAEIVGEYLRKGSLVYIEGKMTQRKYDKDGVEHTSHEIRLQAMEMLGGRSENNGGDAPAGEPRQQRHQGAAPSRPQQRPAPAPTTGGASGFDDMDDDIPFASPHVCHDPMFQGHKARRMKAAR